MYSPKYGSQQNGYDDNNDEYSEDTGFNADNGYGNAQGEGEGSNIEGYNGQNDVDENGNIIGYDNDNGININDPDMVPDDADGNPSKEKDTGEETDDRTLTQWWNDDFRNENTGTIL